MPGGGPTWLTGSYDPKLNLVYWGTGQANPDFIGDKRKGDNLYTECVVALDADTGKLKWYFQFTPHDVHDWDAVEIPVLVDAQFEGQPRKLMVQANRNGYYYVLDRTNGKFLHGTPFVKLLTWSSGLTPEGRPILVPRKEPTLQGNLVCPATAGATNWPSPAYNPDTHYFYAVVTEGCSINYRGSDNFQPTSISSSGTGYIESPEEQKRWQNYVRALDVTTGKLMWEYKQIGSNHYGPGLLSTAGGLLFAGDNQGVLTALDARAGKALWHFSAGEKITASPMAYSVLGNEYVALVSGPNVIAFGLPDRKVTSALKRIGGAGGPAHSRQATRQFSCADGLADVPLRMLGDMGQQSDHRRGQPLPSHFARIGQCRGIDSADDRFSTLKGRVQLLQEFFPGCARLRFCLERDQLGWSELFTLEISHQPIRAGRDMAHMKPDRS